MFFCYLQVRDRLLLMESKIVCPDCAPSPVNHNSEKWNIFLSWLMEGFFKPFGFVNKKLLPTFLKLFDNYFVLSAVKLLKSLGLVKFIESPTVEDTWRTRCLWEEAEKRGIKMSGVKLGGRRLDTFIASYNDEDITFDGLPRPNGTYSWSITWMDDKPEMRERFSAAGIPVPLGGKAWRINQALKIFESLSKPVIIKPSQGSRGRHTSLHIQTEAELLKGLMVAWQLSFWAEIQE